MCIRDRSCICTVAFTAFAVLLQRARPRITVVVAEGQVYKSTKLELLTFAAKAFLNVFAIIYPNAIAKAVASSTDAGAAADVAVKV